MAMSEMCYSPVQRAISRNSILCQFHRSSGEVLTCLDVLVLWRNEDDEFHQTFTDVLRCCAFGDFFWECRPVSFCTLARPFEFVLTNAHKQLSGTKASAASFDEHFRHHNACSVTYFLNLGRDAMLVVPKPSRGYPKNIYGHLASFVRGAPEYQQKELWRQVSEQVEASFHTCGKSTPLWLCTDGRGVPWLHVRLDSAPKYVKHREYTVWNPYETIDNHMSNTCTTRNSRNSRTRRSSSHKHQAMPHQGDVRCGKRDAWQHIQDGNMSLCENSFDLPDQRTSELPPASDVNIQNKASSAYGQGEEGTITLNEMDQNCAEHPCVQIDKDDVNNTNGLYCPDGNESAKVECKDDAPTEELVEINVVYFSVMRMEKSVRLPSSASRDDIAQTVIGLGSARCKDAMQLYLNASELVGESLEVERGLKTGDYIEVIE